MRLVSLILAICFTFNVAASTGTIEQLERHLDEYHYNLSVEWDQKDQAFYEAKTVELFSSIKRLIVEEGLTKDQIILLVESKVNDKKVVDALKLKLSLLAGDASPEELARTIKESSEDFYSRGASWNGQVILAVSVGVLLAAAIGYAIWWNNSHKCVRYGEEREVCYMYCLDPMTGMNQIVFSYSQCLYGPRMYCSMSQDCLEYARK